MYREVLFKILKIIDCFGTGFNFYIDKDRKFYTPLGGIFSLLAFFFGIIVFIFINLEDFLHTTPILTTSIIRENYIKIKFEEEKIWIPWRIRNYNNGIVNHTNLFYPIIYYFKGIKNESTQEMDLSYEFLDYRLCNETSMINRSELYMINISLDNLYCIDMEELIMGGNWESNFINYIEFDLYICKNGIEYNEKNSLCTSYEKIIESSKENNSYEIEIFYPKIYYQPNNKSTPIYIKYESYFYHFSRYSNKIDRLYLQKYMLYDDNGWFFKDIKEYTFWGYSSLKGDSYFTGDKKDLMNEGSSSRLYSFNIYINSDVFIYSRSYTKMFFIIADRLTIVNIVYIFISFIAKIFKISSGNKKLTELLFENLIEKPNKSSKINKEPFNVLKSKNKGNYQSSKKLHSIKKHLSNTNLLQNNNIIYTPHNGNFSKNIFGNTTNNYINDVSSSYIHLSPQHNLSKRINLLNYEGRKNTIGSKNGKSRYNKKVKNNKINFSNIVSSKFNSNFNLNYTPIDVSNNNININIHNNVRNYDCNKSIDSPKHQTNKYTNKKKVIIIDEKNHYNNEHKLQKEITKNLYIKSKLFPYKYYLCSIFIKNVNPNKESMFFTKKFIHVYNFICQLFDISSYLILQREFQIIKNTLVKEKYKEIIENRQKINVNDYYFNTDMKECLDYHKFSILGKVKNSNLVEKRNHNI